MTIELGALLLVALVALACAGYCCLAEAATRDKEE